MDLGEIMNHPNVMARMSKFQQMTPQELAQFKADGYNAEAGDLNEKDDYNCPHCKNKGFIAGIKEWPVGSDVWIEKYDHCKCIAVRSSIEKMEQSGLGHVIRDKTFDKYDATESWQQTIKEAAMQYAKNPSGWFFLGGQPGSGKTHLGTAVSREFLLKGVPVSYMVWTDEAPRIKGAATDHELREAMLNKYKKAKVLFIDDLFKPVRTSEKGETVKQWPSAADIKLAFEILNYRSNSDLPTIISSEFSTDELLDIDEGFGSRIVEKSKAINIAEDRSRNYRLRKGATV